MSRDEVIDHIFANGEQETFLLSVRAFSQRYMVTDEKYESGDYNMENLWETMGVMDNQRTIRMMKPMTEAELCNDGTEIVADFPQFSTHGSMEGGKPVNREESNYVVYRRRP